MNTNSQLAHSIETLRQLIAFPSVSSVSNQGPSDWVSEYLESLDFRIEQTKYQDEFGIEKVNVVAVRKPRIGVPHESNVKNSADGLAYFCHTDVVPPGDWSGPGGDPFVGVTHNNRIYGRGSCDMKGSLAAILTAINGVDAARQTSPLWVVCTADEEIGFQGAQHLIKHSESYREIVASQPLAIIGEPTAMTVVHAHKGIYGFEITSHGRAAHSSTTDGINANVAMVPMLQTILELGERSETDPQYRDPRFAPPTLSWNFGIRQGGTAFNITPERSVAWVTLRPMPNIDGRDLVEIAKAKAQSLGLDFQFIPGGQPLWVDRDAECVGQLCELTGKLPQTVCFGTDGGEFSALQHRVVWGPGNIQQAHTADEWIHQDQLASGIELYGAAVRKWCC